jgi:hypothetical protein
VKTAILMPNATGSTCNPEMKTPRENDHLDKCSVHKCWSYLKMSEEGFLVKAKELQVWQIITS